MPRIVMQMISAVLKVGARCDTALFLRADRCRNFVFRVVINASQRAWRSGNFYVNITADTCSRVDDFIASQLLKIRKIRWRQERRKLSRALRLGSERQNRRFLLSKDDYTFPLWKIRAVFQPLHNSVVVFQGEIPYFIPFQRRFLAQNGVFRFPWRNCVVF